MAFLIVFGSGWDFGGKDQMFFGLCFWNAGDIEGRDGRRFEPAFLSLSIHPWPGSIVGAGNIQPG